MKPTQQRNVPSNSLISSATTPGQHGNLPEKMEQHRSQFAGKERQLDETRARLRQSHARYSELYELAPVGFLTLDRRGRIRELNERAARLLASPSAWRLEKPFVVF